MRVKQIMSEVQLVIADVEVELNGAWRSSPTLCAVLPGEGGIGRRVVPLNTPDGRPIFMKIENAIPVSGV
jgi:formylmethanofuran:tetrahydromethanopterin formyltransferase